MAAWWRPYIAQGARRRGLDPRAVLAIAAVEGLSGGVGDQGTSYGPFQLHRGGALPAGRSRAWAESREGIDYALDRIAAVARGLRGQQAISAISRRFERPADPAGEIAKASALYGRVGAGGGGALPTGPVSTGAGPAPPDLRGERANVLAQLIAQSNAPGRNVAPLLDAIHGLRQAQQAPKPALERGNVGEGVAPPAASVLPSGGPSLKTLTPLAHQFGLQITSTTGGSHVPGSYHYKRRAEDFAGDPARMMKLMQYALHHPRQFTEAFYDPAGFFVKDGKVYRGSIGGHGDHVHLAR